MNWLLIITLGGKM